MQAGQADSKQEVIIFELEGPLSGNLSRNTLPVLSDRQVLLDF